MSLASTIGSSSFQPKSLASPPFTQTWGQEIAEDKSAKKHAAVVVTAQIDLPGAYVVHLSHPSKRGLGSATLSVHGVHGELLLEKSVPKLSVPPSPSSSSSASAPHSHLDDPFVAFPLELHFANVPAALSLTVKKFDAPAAKAKSRPRATLYSHDALSLPLRKLSPAQLQEEADRIRQELAVSSKEKSVAYAAGLIRPFLLMVSLSPSTRQHIANTLGVNLQSTKHAPSSSSSSSSVPPLSASLSVSASLSSSSSSSSHPHLNKMESSLSFIPAASDAPESHRESAVLVRALAAKTHELRASHAKWTNYAQAVANVAAELGSSSSSQQQQQPGGPSAGDADVRPFYAVPDAAPSPAQDEALAVGFAHIAQVFGRDCPDWYTCLDELAASLVGRLVPQGEAPPQSLLLPAVGSLQLRIIACRQPVAPLVQSAELRATQLLESWARRNRQRKAHRDQRPYLVQFEHTLHEVMRAPQVQQCAEALRRTGVASPAVERLLVQVLLEAWLSRVSNFEGGLAAVPQLMRQLGADELLQGMHTVLYRPRKERRFFAVKHSGRLAAVAEIGANAAASGVATELQGGGGGGGGGEGILVGLASAARDAVKKGVRALLRKQEAKLIDAMFELLFQNLLLRARGVFVERYVPGFEAGTGEEALLGQLRDAYTGVIPGLVFSAKENAEEWGLEQVGEWLCEVELPQYVQLFAQHAIDGLALVNTSSDELRALGIPLGHAKRLVALVPRTNQVLIQF